MENNIVPSITQQLHLDDMLRDFKREHELDLSNCDWNELSMPQYRLLIHYIYKNKKEDLIKMLYQFGAKAKL